MPTDPVLCAHCQEELTARQAARFSANFMYQLNRDGTHRRGPFCSVACRAGDQSKRARERAAAAMAGTEVSSGVV